jgi:hypothetical protein
MIFSVQRFLEDHFERRGLADVDQYAIRIANAFEGLPPNASQTTVVREFAGLRTVFYRRNRSIVRGQFESELAAVLRKKFKKKTRDVSNASFARGIAPARARLSARRRSIEALLREFKKAVEARGIDAFWNSRQKQVMRATPEKVAQALLAVFARGVLGSDGIVLREFASGIGFVDVGVSFGGPLHLIELKILKGKLSGVGQLAKYMRTEGRSRGWLVLIDARKTTRRAGIPTRIDIENCSVATLLVDVNPDPPHAVAH